jgi:hypothetical protein
MPYFMRDVAYEIWHIGSDLQFNHDGECHSAFIFAEIRTPARNK